MNETAVLHLVATVLAGAGVLTDGFVRLGCFALAVVGFVAGIALARRDTGGTGPTEA